MNTGERLLSKQGFLCAEKVIANLKKNSISHSLHKETNQFNRSIGTTPSLLITQFFPLKLDANRRFLEEILCFLILLYVIVNYIHAPNQFGKQITSDNKKKKFKKIKENKYSKRSREIFTSIILQSSN